MKDYECTNERFLRDVEDHKLTILKDDGLYRHIRLSRKDSGTYRFDLITIPGYLFITGDMGDWVFSRNEDMFKFFIMGDNDFNKENIIQFIDFYDYSEEEYTFHYIWICYAIVWGIELYNKHKK